MTANERRAAENIDTYNRSNSYDLYDVYGTFSRAKVNAWNYCRRICYENNGSGLKVINHNTFIFTAGFTFTDPETGVIKFMYITPSYNTVVDYI